MERDVLIPYRLDLDPQLGRPLDEAGGEHSERVRDGGWLLVVDGVEHRCEDAPSLLQLPRGDEEGLVAARAVEEHALVGVANIRARELRRVRHVHGVRVSWRDSPLGVAVCVACALARATRVRDVNGMRASRCWYEGRPWREALHVGSIDIAMHVLRGEFSMPGNTARFEEKNIPAPTHTAKPDKKKTCREAARARSARPRR